MFVKFTHVYGFGVGPNVPDCHVKGPFSVRRPLRELQPGPPLNLGVMSQPGSQEGWAQPPYHMTTSSVASGFVEGKNLKITGKRASSTEDLSKLDIPKEELSSLVGGGRYWDQSSIGLADIKLYACKPNVALYALLSVHRHLGCWCHSQRILVPNQFLV